MTYPARPQPEFRHGVYLPRVKVLIFDAVKAAGDIGVTTRQLLHAVYGNKVQRSTAIIRNHIKQMNILLAQTDVHIAARDRRHWLLAVGTPLPPGVRVARQGKNRLNPSSDKSRTKKKEGEEHGTRTGQSRTQRV